MEKIKVGDVVFIAFHNTKKYLRNLLENFQHGLFFYLFLFLCNIKSIFTQSIKKNSKLRNPLFYYYYYYYHYGDPLSFLIDIVNLRYIPCIYFHAT